MMSVAPGKKNALTTMMEAMRTAGIRRLRTSCREEPCRRRRNDAQQPEEHERRRREEEGSEQDGKQPEQLGRWIATVEPRVAGYEVAARGRGHGCRSPAQARTEDSPRLNSVRTVSGIAPRMTNTMVKVMVLSSGSLVRPWAKAEPKMLSPSVR